MGHLKAALEEIEALSEELELESVGEMSLANDGRYPVIELTPQQRLQRTLDALTTQIEALTRANLFDHFIG